MSSSERFEELLREVHGATWDVVLIFETWRSSKDQAGTCCYGVGQIHQQTRCGDHCEQKVEKQDQLGRMRKRASGCSIGIGQQTSDNLDQCLHATQWIPGPSRRKKHMTRSAESLVQTET